MRSLRAAASRVFAELLGSNGASVPPIWSMRTA